MERLKLSGSTPPILILVFNRPDTTQAVFNQIRKARPEQLFVGTDAPRKDHPDDIEKCGRVLEIFEQIDWDCRLSIFTHDENVGGQIGITSAMDWFFSHVEEGIIFEDDCLPDQSFFPFCQELLERYRHDERIMMISGDNFQFGRRRTDYSYYFSRYPHTWGYATWRRVWKDYDLSIKLWPLIRDNGWMNDIFQDKKAVKYWTSIFEGVYNKTIYSHDYQIGFLCWITGRVCILPNTNLISNIGFRQDATHTNEVNSPFANMPTIPVQFPLKHPPFIIRDCVADQFSQRTHFDTATWISRTRYVLGHMLGRI
jgi:hypothetical protein